MATFKIANFMGGLNQATDESLLSPNESTDAQNVDITSGTLRTVSGFSKYVSAETPAGITRLMKFYKTNTSTGATTSHLLAATADAVYHWTGSNWAVIGSGYTSGEWDFINYQVGEDDVLFFGNGEVMKKWDGATLSDWGGSPKKAKSMTVINERVWITGVKEFPYSVYYSDTIGDGHGGPENWTGSLSGDAAGELSIPTWDGGVCIGVANIFSDLVIFKTNTVHRVLGTYPSTFEVREVYSSVGAIAERTIVKSNDRAYFLSKDGLYYYNGVSGYPLLGDKAKDIKINPAYAKVAVSIVYKNKLYCAFPEGDSTVNNAVIVYDIETEALMIWRGLSVTDFMEYEDALLISSGGAVYKIDGDSTSFGGEKIAAHWETPWYDAGAYRITKTADTLYFHAVGNGLMKVDVTFDRKKKTKSITLSEKGKLYSLPINLEGRRFKMRFSNVAGSNFELIAPELTYEADED